MSNKFRIIHDLSHPKKGPSVNDNIEKEKGSVVYDDIATAVNLIQRVGKGAILTKIDIQHAYKLLPIHKDDIPDLGACWRSSF